MSLDEFEHLLNEWLDAPQSGELAAAIDAILADTPALAPVRDQWRRLAERLRQLAAPRVAPVPATLRVAVRRAIEARG